jgi:hypothetical protein
MAKVGTNIELEVEGDTLVIRVNLKETHGVTTSGKSIKIASSEGNVSVPGREDIKVGLNVYTPKK